MFFHLFLNVFGDDEFISSEHVLFDFRNKCSMLLDTKASVLSEPLTGLDSCCSLEFSLLEDRNLPLVVFAHSRMSLGNMSTQLNLPLKCLFTKLATDHVGNFFWTDELQAEIAHLFFLLDGFSVYLLDFLG